MKGFSMKFMQAFVVLIIAIPFAYMAYDVVVEIIRQFKVFLNKQAKPVVIQLLNSSIKN